MMARKTRPPEEGRPGKDLGPIIRRQTSITLPLLPSQTAVPAAFTVDSHGIARLPAQVVEQRALDQRRAMASVVQFDARRPIDKEFRSDPESASGLLVRGGRVRDPVLVMFNLGRITKRQFDAVEAFRDDVALANGANTDERESAGVRTGYTNTNWPSERQLIAMRRVSRTWDEFDGDQQRLACFVIVERRAMDEFAGMRRDRVPALLQEVLRVLVRRHRRRADEVWGSRKPKS